MLLKAKLVKDPGSLLVGARRVIKVLLRRAVSQLEEAVKGLSEVVREEGGLCGNEWLSGRALVMKAARLNISSCDDGFAGICFQLYNRTMHTRELKNVERFCRNSRSLLRDLGCSHSSHVLLPSMEA